MSEEKSRNGNLDVDDESQDEESERSSSPSPSSSEASGSGSSGYDEDSEDDDDESEELSGDEDDDVPRNTTTRNKARKKTRRTRRIEVGPDDEKNLSSSDDEDSSDSDSDDDESQSGSSEDDDFFDDDEDRDGLAEDTIGIDLIFPTLSLPLPEGVSSLSPAEIFSRCCSDLGLNRPAPRSSPIATPSSSIGSKNPSPSSSSSSVSLVDISAPSLYQMRKINRSSACKKLKRGDRIALGLKRDVMSFNTIQKAAAENKRLEFKADKAAEALRSLERQIRSQKKQIKSLEKKVKTLEDKNNSLTDRNKYLSVKRKQVKGKLRGEAKKRKELADRLKEAEERVKEMEAREGERKKGRRYSKGMSGDGGGGKKKTRGKERKVTTIQGGAATYESAHVSDDTETEHEYESSSSSSKRMDRSFSCKDMLLEASRQRHADINGEPMGTRGGSPSKMTMGATAAGSLGPYVHLSPPLSSAAGSTKLTQEARVSRPSGSRLSASGGLLPLCSPSSDHQPSQSEMTERDTPADPSSSSGIYSNPSVSPTVAAVISPRLSCINGASGNGQGSSLAKNSTPPASPKRVKERLKCRLCDDCPCFDPSYSANWVCANCPHILIYHKNVQ